MIKVLIMDLETWALVDEFLCEGEADYEKAVYAYEPSEYYILIGPAERVSGTVERSEPKGGVAPPPAPLRRS